MFWDPLSARSMSVSQFFFSRVNTQTSEIIISSLLNHNLYNFVDSVVQRFNFLMVKWAQTSIMDAGRKMHFNKTRTQQTQMDDIKET